MYNKIDNTIFEKIKTLENGVELFNVIVHSNCYEKTKQYLNHKLIKNIELPFISSFALNINARDLFSIADQNNVSFISSASKVNSLIYDSKQFIGVDNLVKKIKCSAHHSVVIIDTGVYPHIDFCLGKNRIIKFLDLINGREECYDDNGHGTFVAGVLCGNSIVSKYSGVDNNANVIVIKALNADGETDSITILKAMQWIIDNIQEYGIKVVCMSFGSLLGSPNDPLIRGVEVLWNSGICVVCAGGNNGPESNTIMSPGASKKIITVGSLDNIKSGDIKVAEFSSRGPAFNNYKPDVVVPGVDIISTAVFDNEKKFYTKMSGTSVSTPMVAGIISLLYNINPNYTPDQIKYIIVNASVQITGDRNSEGFGWLDARNILI